MTISSRTTKNEYPRYCGTTSTTSAGSVCRRTSRGTAVPTVNEKFTLFRGCTFNRVIDSDSRVRCWALMLTAAFTLVDEDCAVFVAADGCAGCCAAVLAVPVAAGACWAWLLVGACCAWPVAGFEVPVCAWAGWEVWLDDEGDVVCACV